MSGNNDDTEKTEEPTQKKLDDAEKKGQVFQSREINSFMILATFTLLLATIMPGILRDAADQLAIFLHRPDAMPADQGGLGDVLREIVYNIAITMGLPMLAFVVAALVAGFGQKPLTISAEPMKPKWDKISPAKGLGRMFSIKSVVEFTKGLFKISVVGIVCYLIIYPQLGELQRLPSTDPESFMVFMQDSAIDMLMGVIIVVFFIALLDYSYQRFDYYKNLRMSKQEIKDEYKQQEGDPMIKSRLRQIRMERAQKRMMANVPSADVVVTNPTHYAVALKYEQGRMAAPKVVAKGQDKVAFRIREMATKHEVPIVENKPLARALFTVDLDEQVPIEHYKAVAEVISYVYKLKEKKAKGKKGR